MPPNYGQWMKYAQPDDTALLLDQKQTKFNQEVVVMFLHYAQAVNSMMLTALGAIPMEQTKPITTSIQHTN